MDLGLAGRVAVVTGASQGTGRATSGANTAITGEIVRVGGVGNMRRPAALLLTLAGYAIAFGFLAVRCFRWE